MRQHAPADRPVEISSDSSAGGLRIAAAGNAHTDEPVARAADPPRERQTREDRSNTRDEVPASDTIPRLLRAVDRSNTRDEAPAKVV